MDFEVYGVAAVPLIIALVEFTKRIGLPAKFSPVLSVVIGIVLGFIAYGTSEPVKSIITGLVAGLSAVGLWSATKNVVEGVKKSE